MDETRFNEMVSQYERLVYTVCYQLTRNHHIAEDLAQETFLSAYTHPDSCPPDAVKPWLVRIAANKAKDYLKSAYNRKVFAAGEDGIPESGQGILFMSDALPEDIAIGSETVKAIENDIRALKEPYHQVAVLFFLKERSVDEIARRLGRPSKTVHTQLYRAKKILQKKYEGGGR